MSTHTITTELLQLLQLADSALPIGAGAHSYGVETLTAEGHLTPEGLSSFFEDLLVESGPLEATCCRRAYQLAEQHRDNGSIRCDTDFGARWVLLNQRLSARRPARESREARATLGRRFLRLAAVLETHPLLQKALQSCADADAAIHHCTAFGLMCGVLNLGEDGSVLAYMQQSLVGLISACQRLLPVGQMQAVILGWQLHPLVAEIAAQSKLIDENQIFNFAPMLELASMRHANLPVRLFVS